MFRERSCVNGVQKEMNWKERTFKTRLEVSVQSFELRRPPAATFAD
jgi:hypothetical protein